MKRRYTLTLGYVMFIASILWLLFLVAITINKGFPNEAEGLLIVLPTGLISLINIYFFIKVKFWNFGNVEISKIENENILLQKRIEQKELENKLSELENSNDAGFDFDKADKILGFKDGKFSGE